MLLGSFIFGGIIAIHFVGFGAAGARPFSQRVNKKLAHPVSTVGVLSFVYLACIVSAQDNHHLSALRQKKSVP